LVAALYKVIQIGGHFLEAFKLLLEFNQLDVLSVLFLVHIILNRLVNRW
jgi:hypothetical protein